MPVPKRKTSKARRDSRSANKGIKPKAVAACQTCQAPVMPHVLCRECGYYKGVKVLETKTDRKYARVKQREEVASRVQARQAAGSQADNTGATE